MELSAHDTRVPAEWLQALLRWFESLSQLVIQCCDKHACLEQDLCEMRELTQLKELRLPTRPSEALRP